MIKGKTQIHEGELHEIRVLLVEGYSIPKIAEKLGRSKSTLYRLLQNNGIEYKEKKFQYIGGKKGNREKDYVIRMEGISQTVLLRENGKKVVRFLPHHVYLLRARRRSLASRRYCRIEPGGKLENYILEKIKNAWSPKQISGRWRLETFETLSKDTVYRYIYSHHKELIRKYFRRKGKRYCNHRGNRFNEKYQIMNRRMIDERKITYPECETRSEIGHWEGDTVVGIRGGSKEVILTNVERRTGYLLTKKLIRGTGQCVSEATRELFNTTQIPTHKKQSITYDNGREFSEHRMIEYETNMTVFFAHPYHSWERGTNENTNGLLRQFIPKKTDFKYTTEEQLQYYTELINHRPRERLGWLTPHEVFHELSI
ncbi:IS30 family transposase [Candidatus Gracilibacteria bacterium]|nr:IS30 family transposase [Candidatus Gracilibacteria bacterium]